MQGLSVPDRALPLDDSEGTGAIHMQYALLAKKTSNRPGFLMEPLYTHAT
jgi:hypothetical protein